MKSNSREHILNLMDKNLEIRLGIYKPVKETFFEKIFLHIERFFKNSKCQKSELYAEK